MARTGNAFIESALLPLPSGRGTAAKAPTAKVEQRAMLTVEQLARVTGLPLPPPEVAVTEPAEPVVDLIFDAGEVEPAGQAPGNLGQRGDA